MSKAHRIAIKSFNSNHSTYDLFRPSFAPALVNKFLVDLKLATRSNDEFTFHNDKKIVELAAGTGKFTKNLVENGWNENLTVIEPSSGMLVSFKEHFPQIKTYEASSYSIPLEDSSVDSIVIAQGFHWFSDLESLHEIYRVLKPKGTLGLIWNFDVPLVSNLVPRTLTLPKFEFLYDTNAIPPALLEKAKQAEKSFSPSDKDYSLNVAKTIFDDTKWSSNVAEFVYSYDEKVPQYRHGDWRNPLKDSKEFNPIEKESLYFSSVPNKREDVHKYWFTRSYITDLNDDDKLTVKTGINKILDDSVVESDEITVDSDTYLRRALGTHAIVVSSKKE